MCLPTNQLQYTVLIIIQNYMNVICPCMHASEQAILQLASYYIVLCALQSTITDVEIYMYLCVIVILQDIIRWILLSIGFAFIFMIMIRIVGDDYFGPVIVTFLVSIASQLDCIGILQSLREVVYNCYLASYVVDTMLSNSYITSTHRTIRKTFQ